MENKSYFIVAILDDKGTEAIRSLQKEIGIELDNLNTIPHLTLANYEKEIDVTNLLEWVNEFSQKQKPIDLCLYMIAVAHTNGLVAIPLISNELYKLHYDIHQKYDEYCIDYSKLASGWLPHVTISYNSEKIINEKMSVVTGAFSHINTRLISLWVSCLDNGVLTVLGKFALHEIHENGGI